MQDANERRKWKQRYDDEQTGWDRGEPSIALLNWLEEGLFDDIKTVVVPGCGRGYEVVELARRGFEVTAIDFVPAAIESLRAQLSDQNLDANLVVGSIFDFQPIFPFDAIYEQTCICALNPDRWRDYELQLSNWLKPGGMLFGIFMQTGKPEGPPFHCDIEEMRTIFSSLRWDWQSNSRRVDHPSGLHEIAKTIQRIE